MDNLIGSKVGRLTILYIDPTCRDKYICQCECGSFLKSIRKYFLIHKITKSCGCIRAEVQSKKLKDLTGQRFGWLVVTGFAGSKSNNGGRLRSYWSCICDCGNPYEGRGEDLKSGNTRSCGCQHYQEGEKNHFYKHGMREHPLYKRFCHIVERCYRPNHKNYKNYGGRGIKCHQPWLDDRSLFIKYLEGLYPNVYDMIEEGIDQIDRYPDKNGNYEPGNIRLVDSRTNNNNRRNNRMVDVFGEILTLADAVRKYAVVDYSTVLRRINHGWHPEKALKFHLTSGSRPIDFDKPYDVSEYPSIGVVTCQD